MRAPNSVLAVATASAMAVASLPVAHAQSFNPASALGSLGSSGPIVPPPGEDPDPEPPVEDPDSEPPIEDADPEPPVEELAARVVGVSTIGRADGENWNQGTASMTVISGLDGISEGAGGVPSTPPLAEDATITASVSFEGADVIGIDHARSFSPKNCEILTRSFDYGDDVVRWILRPVDRGEGLYSCEFREHAVFQVRDELGSTPEPSTVTATFTLAATDWNGAALPVASNPSHSEGYEIGPSADVITWTESHNVHPPR